MKRLIDFFFSRKNEIIKKDKMFVLNRAFLETDFNNKSKGNVPDFVGVGVPKAGTSWWYSLMLLHPNIKPHYFYKKDESTSKELLFFPHFSYHGIKNDEIEIYKKAFPETSDLEITGEFSTTYFSHPHSIDYLSQIGKTKIILLLRNPIDRTISHLNHTLNNKTKGLNIEKKDFNFFKTFTLIPEAYFYSLYSFNAKRLLENVDTANILVLLYEKCVKDSGKELEKTFKFLDLKNSIKIDLPTNKVNVQEYLINKPNVKERKILAKYFRNDIIELQNLFPEIDFFTYWKDFA